MANTERVSEQITRIKDGLDNSNHTFVTRLMAGLSNHIGEIVADMPIVPTGKQAVVGKISVNMIGSKVVADSEELDENRRKVRQMMDTLKNPSALTELLGE